jgi:predicted restriction endonuclease
MNKKKVKAKTRRNINRCFCGGNNEDRLEGLDRRRLSIIDELVEQAKLDAAKKNSLDVASELTLSKSILDRLLERKIQDLAAEL